MTCWNGLSPERREFLRTQGYVEFGHVPDGPCPNPAEVEVTTMWDEFPGPRFYCLACSVRFLSEMSRARMGAPLVEEGSN